MPKVPAITILQNVGNISSKKRDQVDFLHADKHQTFLRVDVISLVAQGQPFQKYPEKRSLQNLYIFSRKTLGR